MNMKIGIDIQSTVGRKTGIGYYARSLLHEFDRRGDVDYNCYSDQRCMDMNSLQRVIWENLKLSKMAAKDNADILHIPGFAGPMFRRGFKKVTTVCDLIGMIYPENLSTVSRFYWQRWLPACVKNSDSIIAISEHTKHDIMRLLDVPAEKIHVTLLASDSRFRPMDDRDEMEMVRKKYGLPAEFALNVGTVEPRKNICGLIKAYAGYVKGGDDDLDLVIAGKKGWGYERALETVKECGLEGRISFTDYIEDEDLPTVYNLSKFFIYPSLYEGFGLPVLEAMACARPVICSSTSSIPEITGDAAVLVDPEDTAGLSEAIEALDKNELLVKELSDKGLKRARTFSWERTASSTIEVYRRTMGSNS